MSGWTPDWLGVNSYIMYKGQKTLVTDYFFTSSPVHNSDNLWVKMGKLSREFNHHSMKPLPADPKKVPAHVVEGHIVEYVHNGKTELSYVESVYTREYKDQKPETRVSLSNFPFALDIAKVREVTPENKSEEARLRDVYNNQRFFRDSPYFRRMYAVGEFQRTKPPKM